MGLFQEVCRVAHVYPHAVKNTARRLYQAFKERLLWKWERFTITGLQKRLGYQDYATFKRHVYVIMTVSLFDGLGEVVEEREASALKLLPKQIVLDPPEREEYVDFLSEVMSELQGKPFTAALVPAGAAIGAALGVILAPKEDPLSPLLTILCAFLGGALGGLGGYIAGTALDALFSHVAEAVEEPKRGAATSQWSKLL